ncbi:MAG: hypothetical protein JWM36_4834, partial [Hyphomicrobiales bacterium]|nr:hypothetical protein [Hyphomicrobiales bacterium]
MIGVVPCPIEVGLWLVFHSKIVR